MEEFRLLTKDKVKKMGKLNPKSGASMGVFIALGAGIGTAIGAATDNIGLWLGIGVAIGAAIGGGTMVSKQKNIESDENSTE